MLILDRCQVVTDGRHVIRCDQKATTTERWRSGDRVARVRVCDDHRSKP